MKTTKTLIDGREMPAGCVLYRHERELMDGHMKRMNHPRINRKAYLVFVERSQGKAWRDALAAEYAAWLEARK